MTLMSYWSQARGYGQSQAFAERLVGLGFEAEKVVVPFHFDLLVPSSQPLRMCCS